MSQNEDATSEVDVPAAIDPYEVLGLKTTATEDEVKKAYRLAALKNHPGMIATRSLSRPSLAFYIYSPLSLTRPVANPRARQSSCGAQRQSPHCLSAHRIRIRHPIISIASQAL